MAEISLGPIPSSFNAASIRALDPEFWELWDCWNFAQSQDVATRHLAFADMMAKAVKGASALLAKLQALRAMPLDALDLALSPAFTVRDVLEWDSERVAKRELLQGA